MPEKILLADDNYLILRNLSYFLSREGYRVECAITGAQALKLLGSDSFDLVISDISMPEIDGYQLLDQMRAKWKNIPVILMSGNFLVPTRKPDAFFLKPLNLEELSRTIRQCLKKNNPGRGLKRSELLGAPDTSCSVRSDTRKSKRSKKFRRVKEASRPK